MDRIAIERVAANSAPTRVPVEGDSSLEERHWIVRLSADLPPDYRAGENERMASEAATRAVHEARTARGLDAAADEGRVTLHLHSVDARHLIVSIGTVRLEKDDGHAWLVAASAALRSLHEVVPIDDIHFRVPSGRRSLAARKRRRGLAGGAGADVGSVTSRASTSAMTRGVG